MAVVTASVNELWHWKSWVESANVPACDFPLQNLPFCVFSVRGLDPKIGVGIGEFILDLRALASSELLKEVAPELRVALRESSLNATMRCGQSSTSLLRQTLMRLLREDAPRPAREALLPMLTPICDASFHLPVKVGDYTDFYASIHHAKNVGSLFRPEQPLLPNYKFVPIGYHGRASSIVVSGHPIIRPHGQRKLTSAEGPEFGASRKLDYEVELGVYVGQGNALGHPVPIDRAEEALFGVTLLNDWSARDIQAWEYQPLGPFLGKSFATTVSPWVVSMDALQPFRVEMAERSHNDPAPLPYLTSRDASRAGLDLTIELYLQTEAMRQNSLAPFKLSVANVRDLYWSFGQMVAHHSSNGCNLRVGDLLACGTISGSTEGTEGSLLERTRRGAVPLILPTGEHRSFLEDGDEVILTGFCQREGLPRIGLGECRGRIRPAL